DVPQDVPGKGRGVQRRLHPFRGEEARRLPDRGDDAEGDDGGRRPGAAVRNRHRGAGAAGWSIPLDPHGPQGLALVSRGLGLSRSVRADIPQYNERPGGSVVPKKTTLRPTDDDRFHDECGVFGVFNHPEAAHLTYLGLHGLQHRGQESAGIVSSNGEHLHEEKGMGHVARIFNKRMLRRLKGDLAIGHVRYSTTGNSSLVNAQPFLIDSFKGEIGVAHNGNLVNAGAMREALEREGSIFRTSSDTEVILHLIARSKKQDLEAAIMDALKQVEGAYSLIFIARDRIIG